VGAALHFGIAYRFVRRSAAMAGLLGTGMFAPLQAFAACTPATTSR